MAGGLGAFMKLGVGLASWRGALRSEFLRADSDFPKGAVLTLSLGCGQGGGSEVRCTWNH